MLKRLLLAVLLLCACAAQAAVYSLPWGPKPQFIDANGAPMSGGSVSFYAAGSSTLQNTYTTQVGNVANSNPITLNVRGETPNEVWLTGGQTYKMVLKDSAGATVWTVDSISGVNDTTSSQGEWVAGPAPTYVSATSFTLVGDQTVTFHPGRRIKTTNSGGTVYSSIQSSAYGASTTVTVRNDSGSLDSGLSAVSYSLLSYSHLSVPSFIASGTGATARPVVDCTISGKLCDVVSIKDFGAKCDGSTDDTAAIRTAYAASKTLYFPAGTCIVDGSDTGILLTINASGTHLYGDAMGRTIVQAKTGSVGFIFVKGDGVNHANVTIDHIHFYGGSGRGAGNDYGVWLNNIYNATVRDNAFNGLTGGSGIGVIASAGSKDIMVRDNHFNSNSGEDINFYGSDGSIYRVSAIGNHHYQPLAVAIEVEGRSGNTIAGFEVYDVLIANNIIRSDAGAYVNSGDTGILIIGGRGVRVTDNIINRRGTNGIKVIGTQNIAVTKNHVADMGGVGGDGISFVIETFAVGVGGSVNVQIEGNTVDSCNDKGITAYDTEAPTNAQNFIIRNNIVTNCSYGVRATNITNLQIGPNSYRNNSTIDTSYATITAPFVFEDGDNEGTWTPALAGDATAGTQTYTANRTGYWWRRGNWIFFQFNMELSAKDGATAGNLIITGLPTAAINATGAVFPVTFSYVKNIDLDVAGAYYKMSGHIVNNNSYISLLQVGDNNTPSNLVAANFNATTWIIGSGFYKIN